MAKLNVYITHWVASSDDFGYLRRMFNEILRLGIEKHQVVGVPHLVHPLFTQLFCLGQLTIDQLEITIVANREPRFSAAEILRVAGRPESSTKIRTEVVDISNLRNPFEMTWIHKKFLSLDVSNSDQDDLFLYIEHDQLFTQRNLDYFILNSKSVQNLGIRPSFMRVELSSGNSGWVFSDASSPISVQKSSAFVCGQRHWIENPVPYAGMYLFNQADAKIHLTSHSFDIVQSKERFEKFGVSERAALGNAFERIEEASSALGRRVSTTNFVPLKINEDSWDEGCFVWHFSNRYGMNQTAARIRKYGSIPISTD